MENVLGDIDAEAVRPVDPLVAENLPPVVVVTDLNHDFRGHAAHTGIRGAERPAVDQHEVFGNL
ncbi:MAG: hypothetical protein WCE56_06110 [Desulfobacterales bacterium]